MSPPAAAGPLLAVDAGSPRVSVAVGGADGVIAEADAPGARSSPALLALVAGTHAEAGLELGQLGGIVALRGPGSFTGLRVGLATVLGLHQALGLPATAVPTLEVLASLGPGDGSTVVAAVDALRGEWFVQPFRSATPPRALGEPRLLAAGRLSELGPCLLSGFGVGGLGDLEPAGIRALEPPALAAPALILAGREGSAGWDPSTLIEPLYLRPPSARPPSPAAAGRRVERRPRR